MKVVVRRKDNSIPVVITTEYIKLQDAMKLANTVATGGEAKTLIQDEQVTVNGEVCAMRGKKLYPGDKFSFMDQTYLICSHESD
ncbi:MAG: RNA-binding S4 domain-containing protein [Faecousia sp.]